MPKTKLYFGVVVLCILGLLLGSCASEPSPEIRSAAEAKDVALNYLREYDAQNTPSSDVVWQEEDVTPQDWVGGVFKEFTSDEWTVKVTYPVLPPENTIYQVVVSSIKLGWHWKGTVEFDGSVTGLSAFKQMSKEESQRIAEEFVKNSPTFVFDGIEDTLRLTDTLTARCPYCWVFIFEFDSSQPGYGDRTGLMLPLITHHQAVVTVEQLEIMSAVMDDKWDMISQSLIPIDLDTEGMLSVAELLENPVYAIEVKIYGEVGLLGELFCPCFELTSDGETVQVWYDLMVEDSGIEWAPVSVEGIENGDWVIVAGELKGEGGVHYNKGDFWASNIEKLVEASCDDFMKLRHISKEVEVAVGKSFTVALCSNPSTGFQWTEIAQISDQTIVQQTDHKFISPESEPPPPPGTPGQEIWTFKALKKGTTEVTMEYSRPWEGGEKGEWTFKLTVIIK